MKTRTHRLAAWLVTALFAAVLAGCNTMEGMGQDLQAGGQALAGWADRDDNAQQQAKAEAEREQQQAKAEAKQEQQQAKAEIED